MAVTAFVALVSGCATGSADVARSLQDSFNAVAQEVIPSVVRVDVRTNARPEDTADDIFAEPDPFFWEGEGLGSGVIVRRNDSYYFVLTNDHVVANADAISIVLHDDTVFDAELYGRDPRRDLAVLRFASNREIPVARIADSDGVRVGDWVLAVGSPFGYQNTVTVGIVSALGRSGAQINNISDFIQTDAAINQGNSGGALVNLDGEVVGINTWISSRSGFSAGVGFAIPMNNAVGSVDTMIRGEPIEYGWLGVSIRNVDQPVASALGLATARGALVQGVFPDSPAAGAGLHAGDVVTSINGVPVRSSDDLIRYIGNVPAGTRVAIAVIRDASPIMLTVYVAVRPVDAQIRASSGRVWPGITVVPRSAVPRSADGDASSGGVVVDTVDAPALGGLVVRGDIITSVNGEAVSDLLDFYAAIAADPADAVARAWEFTIRRSGTEITITTER